MFPERNYKHVKTEMNFYLSKIDEERFGHVIAKAKLGPGDDVDALLSAARDEKAEMIIVRLPTSELELAQKLEAKGGILSDTLVYYQKKRIEQYFYDLPEGYRACFVEAGDIDAVGNIAAESFKGYFGHYHADPHLDRGACDAVYSSWARNSCCKGDLADEVILIKAGQDIAAFATLKKINATTFEGVLFGVAPAHQGKGLYLDLMKLSQNWGAEAKLGRMIVSTQVTNVVVQKNWCRVGMEPLNSFYTFHVWMNNDSV
jgi:hypothetical protein